jgi:protein-disulfide isomerase
MQLRALIAFAPFVMSALAFSASVGNNLTVTSDTVIADVNGTKITFGEFEEKRAHNLYQPRDAFYRQERKVLDDYINEYLVEQQAKKEGLTVEQLLDKHVRSTLPKDPSEEALHVYYEGVDTKESYEALRPKILERIRQVRFERAKAAYIQTLRSQANVVVSLPPPRVEIALANTPVLGEQNAPVMFIEYADYECPYCQQVAPTLLKLQTEYKGKVAFAFKDTPLPMHPRAEKAAEAARCAGAQGKYWDYHDELFASKKLEVPDLKEQAQKLNLNMAAFNSCLDSGSQAGVVQTQIAESNDLGIQGTPSFFINGRFVAGAATYEQLKDVIDQELATTAKQPKQTASR